MARKVFFSFHHQNDSWRAGQVRNSWLGKGTESTFVDAAAWEEVKQKGDAAVKAWIDLELDGTSVTVVLIGSETANRRYVKYELEQSYLRGNGIVGVFIHGIKDQKQQESSKGRNPLRDVTATVTRSFLGLFDFESEETLAYLFKTYYWLYNNGRDNLPTWIEDAAIKRDEPPLRDRRLAKASGSDNSFWS